MMIIDPILRRAEHSGAHLQAAPSDVPVPDPLAELHKQLAATPTDAREPVIAALQGARRGDPVFAHPDFWPAVYTQTERLLAAGRASYWSISLSTYTLHRADDPQMPFAILELAHQFHAAHERKAAELLVGGLLAGGERVVAAAHYFLSARPQPFAKHYEKALARLSPNS